MGNQGMVVFHKIPPLPVLPSLFVGMPFLILFLFLNQKDLMILHHLRDLLEDLEMVSFFLLLLSL
ncbi:MAG: hypothetical protein CMG80_18355 [Marinobacter sp.]|nr:hypothetical protein [Marinobacter sp.]